MPTLIVLTPLINFLKFSLLGTKVHRSQLSILTVASMGFLLISILSFASSVSAGVVQTTSLGV